MIAMLAHSPYRGPYNGKILCHKTDPKNWTYITNNAFWLRGRFFEGLLTKKIIFHRIPAVGYLTDKCAHTPTIIRLVEHSTRNWSSSPLPIFSERELTFTITFVICRRPCVCRLSVTFLSLTQTIEIFGNILTPFGTLAICWHPGKISRRSSQGNPSVGGVKHKRDSRI